APAGTIAALDLIRPVSEFNVEARGRVWPAGHTVRKPSGPAGTTATFSEYALASAGMPQTLSGIVKSRLLPPLMAGPPNAPAALRVSAMRQGVTGRKRNATGLVLVDETTRFTADPALTMVPAAGLWLITLPAGTLPLAANVTVPTINPAPVIVAVAAACVRFTTFGVDSN